MRPNRDRHSDALAYVPNGTLALTPLAPTSALSPNTLLSSRYNPSHPNAPPSTTVAGGKWAAGNGRRPQRQGPALLPHSPIPSSAQRPRCAVRCVTPVPRAPCTPPVMVHHLARDTAHVFSPVRGEPRPTPFALSRVMLISHSPSPTPAWRPPYATPHVTGLHHAQGVRMQGAHMRLAVICRALGAPPVTRRA